jgi:hypothetical protein
MFDFDNNPELSSRTWFDPDVLGASPGVSRVLTSVESTELFPAVQMSDCWGENRSIPDSSQQGPQLSQQGDWQQYQDQDQDFSNICECCPVGIVINLKLRKLRRSVHGNSD